MCVLYGICLAEESLTGQCHIAWAQSWLLMHLKWRTITNPKQEVILHSDQGAQFSSYDWQIALKTYRIKPSMSRRGNCYDNAVVESFFKILKKEAVKKQIFITREEAKSKLFAYIEMFYNSKRRHSYLGYISPLEFEKRYN